MSQTNIFTLLKEIQATKEKLSDAKLILKGYKIKSPKLTQLVAARKGLTEQINEEKERIIAEFYEDKDFEQAKNDELTYKNQLKEKVAMLKVEVKSKYKLPQLQTEDHVVNGEPLKLQLEFAPTIYINGKESK